MAKSTKTKKNVSVNQLKEVVEQQAEQAQQQETQPGQQQVQVNVDFLRTTRVHIAMPC